MNRIDNNNGHQKIIHVDMDCFYAAIEIRDDPSLIDKPVAVGGPPEARSVLCTCNYTARKFGVRSAMSSAHAKKLCPDLIILPVNMNKYREVSKEIQEIFYHYTLSVEPLSLDEAYLDVTSSEHCQGIATFIAKEIKQKIYDKTRLTASAGVAPNKFLAKIASGWQKPNGLFVIKPNEIENFVKNLKVTDLFGVGKVTAEKLHKFGLVTCHDVQKWSQSKLISHFGKLGETLYNQSRGIDNRKVEANKIRKSLSVVRTFNKDLKLNFDFSEIIKTMYTMLVDRINNSASDRFIKNIFIKIKTSSFQTYSMERSQHEINLHLFENLFKEFCDKDRTLSIRLLGIGVHFANNENNIEDKMHSFENLAFKF